MVTSPRKADAAMSETCINCGHVFAVKDVRGFWGMPGKDVGPCCESCYATVRRHEHDYVDPDDADLLKAFITEQERLRAELATAEARVQILRGYAQHKSTCGIWKCRHCHFTKDDDNHYIGTADSHDFEATECDCGLTGALVQADSGKEPQ